MRRYYPDPDQRLFEWVWKDEEPANNEPPPLRARVQRRSEPAKMMLWGRQVVVEKVTRKTDRDVQC